MSENHEHRSVTRVPIPNPNDETSTVSTSIIIVNYRSPLLTIDCLQSLANEPGVGREFNVVLIENASPDDSYSVLSDAIAERGWASWIKLIQSPRNGGFAFGNNLGIRHVLQASNPPKYVLLLNPDTVIQPGAVHALRQFMETKPDVGIAGSRLEDPDGTSQCAARRFPGILSEFETAAHFGPISRLLSRWIVSPPENATAHTCDWLPGASLMIRREVLETVGLLDEEFFMYYEEVDFCMRAKRAGWPVWYVPESRVVHLVGQSSGVTSRCGTVKRLPKYWFDSRHRYFRKNYGIFKLFLANVAWIFGLTLNNIKNAMLRRPSPHPPHLLRDSISHEWKSH